eukprot:maker-scaffold204_size260821-snap-gene-1.39 protein:Tk07813 transcript:maker-scaffold204_size260821-snap-gene-1.39-mRNA-1 annotation:"cuticle protein 19"
MKCFVVLALVGMAVAYPMADNQDPYAPPPQYEQVASYEPSKPAYRPSPSRYQAKEEEYIQPQPYNFEYGVSDQYTGTAFKANENQDDVGTVLGSYEVQLPDGRLQRVTYRADHEGGFVADVAYEGEAQYPPEPAEGYGNSYKQKTQKGYAPAKYAPAPQPYES